MATVNVHGFTVIELMLFLGVTGALFAALMVGVNSNITSQRYRESVQTYSSLLQDQYSQVANTQDDRDDNWKCVDGTVTQQPGGGDVRGTSPCVLLGRAIQVTDNGTSIKTTAVVGAEPAGLSATSDIDTLVAYKPTLASLFDSKTSSVDWGSKLVSTDHNTSIASFLILRSPASGLLRVFASSMPLPADLSTMIVPATAATPIVNCMQGSTGPNPIQSITVDPRVAGQAGVKVNEADPACE
jgi:type II secretory pathway pseudopilin PulG